MCPKRRGRREIFGGVTIALAVKVNNGYAMASDSATTVQGVQEGGVMKKALMGASAAAVIALAPLCIPPVQAHADDPCVSITDPAVHQACFDKFLRDDPLHRYQGNCKSSPDYGAEGQVCRDFWVRKSAPPASRQLSEP
jgi:hypothetical protein